MLDGRPGRLVLEDGAVFEGILHGPARAGEVVFTTAMTGYPEVATDPSFRDQLVVMCFPLIGIYGQREAEHQSHEPHVGGMIVHDLVDRTEGDSSLLSYLLAHDRPILSGIDTRALVRHLRTEGSMLGAIGEMNGKPFSRLNTRQMILAAACTAPTTVAEAAGLRVVVVDYGVKRQILTELASRKVKVRLLPPTSSAQAVLAERPDLVVLSPGPGDPADLPEWTEVVAMVAERVPVFGICLGHQLLATAFGGSTYKLRFGHRGANHPVRDEASGLVRITAQNHGYAVDEQSLGHGALEVTHRNANDHTVEGLRHRELPIRSLQYHPEAAPGPRDERAAFDRILAELVGERRA